MKVKIFTVAKISLVSSKGCGVSKILALLQVGTCAKACVLANVPPQKAFNCTIEELKYCKEKPIGWK